MSSLKPDQLLHIFGLPLSTKWKQGDDDIWVAIFICLILQKETEMKKFQG